MILLIGANGMLGQDVKKALIAQNYEFKTLTHSQLDISSYQSCLKMIEKNVEVIINCAAYTAVDNAEDDVINAYKTNTLGPGNLAKVADLIDAKLVHISTDYVFDGVAKVPYSEIDNCQPQSVYGKTKFQGELLVAQNCKKYFILRTAWLFGTGGNNFIKTMLSLRDKEFLNVVDDQIGQPTGTIDLVSVILKLIKSDSYGTYHVTSSGSTSWYEFAKYIFEQKGIKMDVRPCSSQMYPTKAIRPENSVLEHLSLQAAGIELLPDWKVAVKNYLKGEEL